MQPFGWNEVQPSNSCELVLTLPDDVANRRLVVNQDVPDQQAPPRADTWAPPPMVSHPFRRPTHGLPQM
ncbi:hypothetical protein EDD27_7500 [Nonomuraea polychroma]|uniref:Uncharacterized protein n=1 Tax=Nonomuraea polychroma TaxID=46176 RepID=A0A438MG34_9ACTN|nr:hypothetical protein EDD27_7500 [Nonomuraea polychroma]